MSKFIALLISGSVSGAIYSLMAAGLVLSYSTSNIFNFAHGAVAFSTALVFYELNSGLGWNVWLATAVAAVLYAPALGVLLDKVVFRHLVRADDSAKIVATVGLSIAIPSLTLWVIEVLVDTFGVDIPRGDNVFSPPGLGPTPKHNWTAGPIRLDSNQLVVLAMAALVAVGLWVLLRRTSVGLRMRAAVERPSLARSHGIDTVATSRTSWALGFGLAGLAGVAGAPLFTLTPVSYTTVLFVAATAAVFGGLRSIPLAFLGGLLLGVVQSLFAGYATFAEQITGMTTSIPFIMLLVALLVMNRDRGRIASQVADVALPPDYHSDLAPWRRRLPWAIALAVLIGYVVFVADIFWQGLMVKGLALGLIFLSFVIVTGVGGMVSLAQATFVTSASLVTGLAMSHGLAFIPAAALGVGAAMVAGMVVAAPAIRLGGLALALSTLALALIGERVLFSWDVLRNGSSGWRLPPPVLGPVDLGDPRWMMVVLLILIGSVTAIIGNLTRSASGREINAVRSAPPAATSIGISLMRSKLWVFALSAGVAGLGGVLLSTFNGSITNQSFPASLSLVWLAIVVLFGIRRPGGAVVAGIVFAVSPQVIGWITSSTRVADVIFGLGAVQLARSPDGILSLVSAGNAQRRRRRRGLVSATSGSDAAAEQELVQPAKVSAEVDRPEAGAAASEVSARALVVTGDDGQHDETIVSSASLQIDDVVAGYGDVEVLHGVDLTLAPGTLTALLGANGAGKSTLCGVAAGHLSATAGSVSFEGVRLVQGDPTERARLGIAYLPESRGVFPGLTVEENLRLALGSNSDRDAVNDRFPSLATRSGVLAGSLSGGEQQMLAIAPLLVRPPRVLIADEPSLGLAPLVVEQVMALLSELRNGGCAVLVVEERASHLLELADQAAVLELGRVSWSGPSRELDAERLATAYLHTSRAERGRDGTTTTKERLP